MLHIGFIGHTGSGKSTHASKVAGKYGLFHLDSGEMIRKLIKKGTELGKEMEKYVSRGENVPDDVVKKLVSEKVKEDKKSEGYVFDGFPRNRDQAQFLDELMEDLNSRLHIVFYLETGLNNAKKRIMQKHREKKKREKIEIRELMSKKLESEKEQLAELTEYYEGQNKLFKYNARDMSLDSLQSAIEEAIDKVKDDLS